MVYRNLNRRRRRAFQLRVTGTLPNGSTVELVRNVHIGEACSFNSGAVFFIYVATLSGKEHSRLFCIVLLQIQLQHAGFISLTMAQQLKEIQLPLNGKAQDQLPAGA